MRLVLVSALLLLGAACGKKTYEPYYAIERQEKELVEQLGDDAWDSPQMHVIVQALDAVPADTRERERAVALAQTIALERMRVQKARLAQQPPPPPPAPPPRTVDTALPHQDVVVVERTAPQRPAQGMSRDAFRSAFGDCVSDGSDVDFDGGTATTLVTRGDGPCAQRFGRPGVELTWLFVDDRLWGTRVHLDLAPPVQAVDGGVANAPPEDVTPRAPGDDGGNVMLLIPGAPLPAALRPRGVQWVDAGS